MLDLATINNIEKVCLLIEKKKLCSIHYKIKNFFFFFFLISNKPYYIFTQFSLKIIYEIVHIDFCLKAGSSYFLSLLY